MFSEDAVLMTKSARSLLSGLALAALLLGAGAAQGLAMGPDEFGAARRLTCVLAQESLGYLSEKEYGELTSEVLEGFDAAESDVVYAKALGYYDGLMFGLPGSDESQVNDRLQQYLGSAACRMYTGYEGVSLSL